MVGVLLAAEAFKVGSNTWILSIGVIQGHIQGDSINGMAFEGQGDLSKVTV